MALELSRRLKPLGCALRNDSPISQNWASKGAAASSMIRELLAPESYCQSQKVVTASNRHNQETVTIRKLLLSLLDPDQSHVCCDPHQQNRYLALALDTCKAHD